MILEYIHADNTKQSIPLNYETPISKEWRSISASNKLNFIKEFLPAYRCGQKIVLFDSNHKQLLKYYEENDINKFENSDKANEQSQLLFFTSGSSGFPVGAFKTKKNLEEEVKVLKTLLDGFSIKKVVVTVPFVHIYGVLAGLLLPLSLEGVTCVVKDDFLPYEILNEASGGNTLVITTPVFIKALSKLREEMNLASNLFISSTGPLDKEDIELFQSSYKTNLLQLFGSTETGGIAYKFGTAAKWSTLKNVSISSLNTRLSVSSPYISHYILDKNIVPLIQPFQTEDIVEIEGDAFTLIGRSNKIIKIAGKRISALQIEAILETIPDIQRALVEIVYKKELIKSEQIRITLQATKKISKQSIKKKMSEFYGVLSIPFTLHYVDTISFSSTGKKIFLV